MCRLNNWDLSPFFNFIYSLMRKINLFDIQKSSPDIKRLKDNINIGLDITTDIIDNLSGMLILGSILKIRKSGLIVYLQMGIKKLNH